LQTAQGPVSFHPNLFVMPEPSRTMPAKIQRDLLARGIFTSVQDLARKISKYIPAYAKVAKPFRWSYSDPTDYRQSNRWDSLLVRHDFVVRVFPIAIGV
jgi:hypothetical protein